MKMRFFFMTERICWACNNTESNCNCRANGDAPIFVEKPTQNYAADYLAKNGTLLPICGDNGTYDLDAYPDIEEEK
jgi:hypothetical protein